MNILVCIKRVPVTGAKITLTEDEQAIDTRFLGFFMSPHEECALEEAVRLVKEHDGTATALTLGPADAAEQLRYALSMGLDEAILLETDDGDWDPMATARAITAAIQTQATPFDVLLFGNESADSGGYQVGVRVAHALGLPIVTGIKALEIDNDQGRAVAKRETAAGWEIFEVPLPAVFSVKEGINLPHYPSVPGRLRAKRKPITTMQPEKNGGGLNKVRLKNPPDQSTEVEILGEGPTAAPQVVDILDELGVLSS